MNERLHNDNSKIDRLLKIDAKQLPDEYSGSGFNDFIFDLHLIRRIPILIDENGKTEPD